MRCVLIEVVDEEAKEDDETSRAEEAFSFLLLLHSTRSLPNQKTFQMCACYVLQASSSIRSTYRFVSIVARRNLRAG